MILRDPVHGLVSFESAEEEVVPMLMDTPEVQRLRRIRQLGVASFAFPGAEHTRFSHAVGAAFVMKQLVARLRGIHDALPFWQQLTTDRARDALAAALLHDVGHGPLSHLFEDVLPGTAHHEEWTSRVILDPSTGVHQVLARLDPAMPERVAALVHGEHPLAYLAKAVSGTFDVDRCDYLLRDAHSTGVRYGLFDLDWLLRSLRFAPAPPDRAPGLAIDGAKGLPAIEAHLVVAWRLAGDEPARRDADVVGRDRARRRANDERKAQRGEGGAEVHGASPVVEGDSFAVTAPVAKDS